MHVAGASLFEECAGGRIMFGVTRTAPAMVQIETVAELGKLIAVELFAP